MKRNILISAAVAAAFAAPLAVYAAGDKKSDTGPSAAATTGKSDGGAEAMFKAMDKNKDGYISKKEAKGTPHEKEFAKLDKNHDGKLSREEHAAAPEHAGKADKSASSSSSTTSPSASTSSGPVPPSAANSSTGGKSSKY